MDPILTNRQAHRIFGELYRKPRPPALQGKVDEIVRDTSDIFLRIKRINHLDRKELEEKDPQKKKDSSSSLSKQEAFKTTPQLYLDKTKIDPTDKRGGIQRQKKKRPGFFARLFRRASNEFSIWGAATGTLKSSLFYNLELSPAATRIFSGLNEKNIVKTIKALRFASENIWESVDANTYNTLIATYQFFLEYIKFKNLFTRQEKPQEWINETLEMQRHYGQLIQYADYKRTLLEVFPKYMATAKGTASEPVVKNCMQHIIRLDGRKPTLKNVIIAFYVLADKQIHTWETIAMRTGVHKPIVNEFHAPRKVKVLITQHTHYLRNEHEQITAQIKEIKNIHRKYLSTDKEGVFNSRFLDQLIYDTICQTYGRKSASIRFIQSYKSQPNHLLFALLRDFSISYIPILSTTVNVNTGEGSLVTVNIFKPDLFKKHIEGFNQALRSIDAYVRKYPGLGYSFSKYVHDLQNKIFDPSIERLHQIIREANSFFQKIVRDVQTVLNNHLKAKQNSHNKNNPKVMDKESNAFLPIESLEPGERYLPYAEAKLILSGRLKGKTIESVIENLIFHMYNYLYIFRDSTIRGLLNGLQQLLQKEIQIKKELDRLKVNSSSTLPT